jgi:hypothetical protein
MSVKKMGSKLALGVRQIKAQQAQAAPSLEPVTGPVAPVGKKALSPNAARPAPVQAREKTALHPQRVWPD